MATKKRKGGPGNDSADAAVTDALLLAQLYNENPYLRVIWPAIDRAIKAVEERDNAAAAYYTEKIELVRLKKQKLTQELAREIAK
jgi:hypothetical protein